MSEQAKHPDSSEALRLECLKLALQVDGWANDPASVIESARRMEQFVSPAAKAS